MDDKAGVRPYTDSRQAGADEDLRRYFPELDVPGGLTLADLEAAEQMVFDWEDNGDWRAFGLVLNIFQHLLAASRVAQ